MNFEESILWGDTLQILHYGVGKSRHYLTVTIRAGELEIVPIKVLTLETVRDYEMGYADEILLEVMLGLGTFNRLLRESKDQLVVTVHMAPVSDRSGGMDLDGTFTQTEYKGILLDGVNAGVDDEMLDGVTTDKLDLGDILSVKFQLLPRAVEQLRAVQVGGVYRNVIPGELIRSQIDLSSQSITVDDNDAIAGVEFTPFNNQVVRDHVVVPHGTSLVDLAGWVQKNGGGVYNAGLGCYLQGNHWYLYPCYNVNRYDECQETLNVINVPPRQLPSVERTYMTGGGSTTILSTGEFHLEDTGEVRQLQSGNGERYIHSEQVYGGGVEVEGNRLTVARGVRGTEAITSERRDGFNRAPINRKRKTSNPFDHYTDTAKGLGVTAALIWENSNPTLLYPGQPVKLSYLKEGKVIELRGVLLHAVHRTALAGQGITSTSHRTDSALTFFLERPVA